MMRSLVFFQAMRLLHFARDNVTHFSGYISCASGLGCLLLVYEKSPPSGVYQMRKTSIVGLIVAAALFSGCAALGSLGSSGTNSTSQTESLATASGPGPSPANIVGRSTKFIFMSPSAVLAGSRDVEKALVQEQCMFHSANPPFLVPALGQKWVFIGRMNQGPTMQALNYRSIFTLGLTGAQQLNGWPVCPTMSGLAKFITITPNCPPPISFAARSAILCACIAGSRS